ncbi:hypothetical protein [Streptomyces triculaminicus]|uniref:hypothetical protein n=1 Tax=Streptomyces triculaminicus TaxID=2816232 RepID=UPI001F5F39C7|nr:hypothetical protein [Streptomyces triculaminicus]
MCAPHTAPETLVALTGPTATGTRRALELLAGTGLLTGGDRPAFREPAAARAVLAGMNAHDREELYARAAEHAHHTAVPDGALASMLTGARVLGAPWAVDVLRREAARHRVAGRPGEAARLLRRALREPMAPHLRVRTLTELSAAVLPSEPDAADRHLRQALRSPADADAGPSWIGAADLLVARGDVARAQPLIARALAGDRVRPAERSALRALYWLAAHSRRETSQALDRPPYRLSPSTPTTPPRRPWPPGARPCSAGTSAGPGTSPGPPWPPARAPRPAEPPGRRLPHPRPHRRLHRGARRPRRGAAARRARRRAPWPAPPNSSEPWACCTRDGPRRPPPPWTAPRRSCPRTAGTP